MMRLLTTLTLGCLLWLGPSCRAMADIHPDPPSSAQAEPQPGLGDVVIDASEAFAAVRVARNGPTVTTVALALGGVLWVGVALLRKFGTVLLSPARVRVVVVGVSGLAAVAGWVGAGLPWQQVVQLAMAGPIAVFLQEMGATPVHNWRRRRANARGQIYSGGKRSPPGPGAIANPEQYEAAKAAGKVVELDKRE